MKPMKCPDCGAQDFYAKDPEDQFNISEFTVQTGKIEYRGELEESELVEVVEETEIFCDRCAWHDTFKTLKNGR